MRHDCLFIDVVSIVLGWFSPQCDLRRETRSPRSPKIPMIKKIAGKATQNPFHSRKIVRMIAQIPFHASTPTAARRRRPCPPWAGRPAQVPRKAPTTTIQKEVVIQPVHGRLHHRGSKYAKATATAQERSVQPVAVSWRVMSCIDSIDWRSRFRSRMCSSACGAYAAQDMGLKAETRAGKLRQCITPTTQVTGRATVRPSPSSMAR